MRALLQRVSRASVRVGDRVVGSIDSGWAIFLGVGHGDTPKTASLLANRVANLRAFADDVGRMNRSLLEDGGSALVVSQFTLYGSTDRGRRPSFTEAAPGAIAA